MAAVTLATFRQRIAARVTALGGTGADKWNESPFHFDLFGKEPRTVRHLCFSVGVPKFVAEAASGRDRQRVNVGAKLNQAFVVAFMHDLKPNDQLTSVDAALLKMHALINQLCQQDGTWPLDFHVLLTGAENSLLGDFQRFNVAFVADPLIALQ